MASRQSTVPSDIVYSGAAGTLSISNSPQPRALMRASLHEATKRNLGAFDE